MGHELAHVAQQQRGVPTPQRKVGIRAANSPAEAHADAVSARVVASDAAPSQLLVDAGTIVAGQMLKAEFLAQLKAAVTSAAAQELGKLGATVGCPYIERYFTRYGARPPRRVST